jgi:hypothetical protein
VGLVLETDPTSLCAATAAAMTWRGFQLSLIATIQMASRSGAVAVADPRQNLFDPIVPSASRLPALEIEQGAPSERSMLAS